MLIASYIDYISKVRRYSEADNTYYTSKDNWQLEYYFKVKDPSVEQSIEALLLQNGYKYDKSEDVYIEDEDVFVIYYDI